MMVKSWSIPSGKSEIMHLSHTFDWHLSRSVLVLFGDKSMKPLSNTFCKMGITALAWILSTSSSDDLAVEAEMCRRLKESDSYAACDVHLLDRSGIPSVLKGKTCLQTTVRPCPFFHWNTALHVHNSSWRFLWRQESRANLAPSLWQRQLAFPFCVPRLFILETLSRLPPLISPSHSETTCSLITLHWTTYLLDRAWIIKSFADPIKWKKLLKKTIDMHTQATQICMHHTPLISDDYIVPQNKNLLIGYFISPSESTATGLSNSWQISGTPYRSLEMQNNICFWTHLSGKR